MFNSFLINQMINLLPLTKPTLAQHDMHNTKYSSFTATSFGIRKPSPETAHKYILNLKNTINLHDKKTMCHADFAAMCNVCNMKA
jgi:hypothetical protein